MKVHTKAMPSPIRRIGNGKYEICMDSHEVQTVRDGKAVTAWESECVRIAGKPTYPVVVEALIRERYTVSDELAIQRQKDLKYDRFVEYNRFVEACKAKARPVFFPEEGGE